MNKDKSIYFAVKAFILQEGRFLAMHKSEAKDDLCELPGGRMEFGETAEETLVREISEEAGLRVEQVKLLDTWNYVAEDYQITGIIYLCRIVQGEVKLSQEHDSFKWLQADHKALDEMHPVFKERMIHWEMLK